MEGTFQPELCDFSGWATRNDLKCSDGRTIRRDAFKHNDGTVVPLVWNHQHNDPRNTLGHAYLENRPEGVYAYGFFNDTESGEIAKALVKHGDITALSIFANQLQEKGHDVYHGEIKEVSLVLAGANPGAFIDNTIQHGDGCDDEAVIYTGMPLYLAHADTGSKSEDKGKENKGGKEDMNSSDDEKKKSKSDEKTLKEVVDTMTEEQKTAMYALIGMALEGNSEGDEDENKTKDEDEESKGGNNTMKHNVFDNDQQNDNFLSHADQEGIISLAKSNSVGSLKTAIEIYSENNSLAHGIENIDVLFPEYKDVRPGAPELVTNDQGWVGEVLKKVHKSPISRIRTRLADIRNAEQLRAKGYRKGDRKLDVGNFNVVYRTTDPQTVYVKSKLDRDDIVDITDFDVVQYMYGIDRMNLNEELATAIMIGDGREDGAEGKIAPDKIRPVWGDDSLYTIYTDVNVAEMRTTLQGSNTSANFGDNYVYAEAVIQSLLYAREQYKGSGTPDFYCTPHLMNMMLLARDLNGRRIYEKVSDLAAAINVGQIITAEQFEGKTRTANGKTKKLLGIMYNLADYSLGSTKGGEITHFTDFDIDFNQEKSLLETRCSGANTRILSAIALEEDTTVSG